MGIGRGRENLPLRMVVGLNEMTGVGLTELGGREGSISGSAEGPHAGCPALPRKTLQVKIVDDEEYEKKDNFFIELGQPQWLKRGISGEG